MTNPEAKTEFLLARIAEVEARVAAFDEEWETTTVLGEVPIGLAYFVDTSRVLAECKAKRRIVEEHSFHVLSNANLPHWLTPSDGPLCVTCASGDENGADWPCATIRALASVYADHADYREEDWRA